MSIKHAGQVAIVQIFRLVKSKLDSLSKVAISGSYKDLSDTPKFEVGVAQISSNSVTAVNIPSTITSLDRLLVYHNGLLLNESIHYNLSKANSSIALIGYTASAGDIFSFISL